MGTIKGYKNGKLIDINIRDDKQYKKGKLHSPMTADRIMGVDTESLIYEQNDISGITDLRTLSVQLHTDQDSFVKDTRNYFYPITACLDMIWDKYSIPDVNPFKNEQRKKRKRELPHDKRVHRDGRPNTIAPILWVFYNLEYDFGRLFRQNRQMKRIVSADMDSVKIVVGDYEIEIVTQLIHGSCPSFEYFVRKDNRILRILGMDIGAYWKGGLSKTAQAILKGEDKVKVSKEIFNLTIQMFDAMSQEDKDLFWRYASEDARLTREIYLATVDLLIQVQPLVIKRNGLIPASAPGAAAKIAFSMGPDEWDLPPNYVQQAGMYSYAGARVFNRKNCYVDNISVWDINSAYPHVMTLLPNPANCRYKVVKPGKCNIDDYRGKWGVVLISGEGTDKHYPALRLHDTENNRLRYIYGKFDKIWCTIPEMVIGVVSGRLAVTQIHSGFTMEGSNEESFLKKFVLEMYAIKSASEKGSPMYLLSKLLINALYGKLVEVKISNAKHVAEDAALAEVLKIPEFNDHITEVKSAYAQGGREGLEDLYWEWAELYPECEDVIHFFELFDCLDETGKAGYYFLAMHGAQITGFVSAKLGLAASCTDAIQGDTDSIFLLKENEMNFERYGYIMDLAGYDCPMEGLGAFEKEIEHASGYLVKNKMYALKYEKKGKTEYKIATHGITGLKLEKEEETEDKDKNKELLKEKYYQLIEEVAQKGKATYQARQVQKTRQAYLQDKVPGLFFEIEREITSINDPNQEINDRGERVWKKL